MPTLFVFAEITPKPAHVGQARDAIMSIIKDTRAEPGCLSFELFDNKADGTLFLLEEWRSQADLDAHYAMPYTANVFSQYDNWLAGPPVIRKMQKRA